MKIILYLNLILQIILLIVAIATKTSMFISGLFLAIRVTLITGTFSLCPTTSLFLGLILL